jgi:pimeloyl-ACP methyl ester carboxylesterase
MKPTQYVSSGEVKLAVYTWGQRPTQRRPRPTLVLVHGYPDSAEVWTKVAKQLTEQFFVVAYDVRGAGHSSAPRGAAAYAFEYLSADLLAVLDSVSPLQPVHLVGHDWGALQSWEALLSGALDGRVASFSTAAPSLDHLGNWFRKRLQHPTPRHVSQMLGRMFGSSYMLMMQLPWLPELSWKLALARAWPRLVSTLEGVPVAARAGQSADAVHGLGLYRANLLPRVLHPQSRRTEVPVQLLVMRRDPFVPAPLFDGLESTAPNLQRAEFDAGHWGLLSCPRELARGITDFVLSLEEV